MFFLHDVLWSSFWEYSSVKWVCKIGQDCIMWGVLFPLNPTPVLPLPGCYGEGSQLQLSSICLSHMWLCLQNMTVIQACGSYRSRCILGSYFLFIYHLPLKAQDASSSQYVSKRDRPANWSVPENTLRSGWCLANWPCQSTSHALRGCT